MLNLAKHDDVQKGTNCQRIIKCSKISEFNCQMSKPTLFLKFKKLLNLAVNLVSAMKKKVYY